MEHGELVRRLLATFVVELGEHATALQRDLLALEQAAGPARAGLVDALFRTAHTVKGAARAAGVEAIERAAGAVEELLAQARDGARTVDAGAVNLLLEVVDALADAGAALDQGRPLDGRAITRVQPRLDAMAHGGGEVGGPAEPVAPGPQPAQAAVGDRLDAVAELAAELLEQVDRLPAHAGVHRLARRLAEAIDDLRLVPLAGATLGLERAVRDLAVTLGKRVTLTIEGTELELDPTVVAGLRDPLLHLIRNAVDHGLEAPADRVAAGKPATGRITVSARLAGEPKSR